MAVGVIRHCVSLCVHVHVFSPQDESGSVRKGGLCACEDLISISKYELLFYGLPVCDGSVSICSVQ